MRRRDVLNSTVLSANNLNCSALFCEMIIHPAVTTHFFARMTKLLMHPEDASYGKLTAYVTNEAQLPLRTVHCFKAMFKSDGLLMIFEFCD